VGVNELVTRLQFILYLAAIVGIFTALLQPYVSERDINLLSYVGLDRVARKLLSVRPSQPEAPLEHVPDNMPSV
jgi:hypothetical protein